MKEIKRGTIEDRSTDRILALAFDQAKAEQLLRVDQYTNSLEEHGASVAAEAFIERRAFSMHESIGRALDDAERRGDSLDYMLKDMNYGGERSLTVAIAAVDASIKAGITRTPQDALLVLERIRDGLSSGS